MFSQLIHPHTEKEFFKSYWEQKPLLIKGKSSLSDIYSLKHFEEQVEAHKSTDEIDPLIYSLNLNVCKCVNGEKIMLNPDIPSIIELEEVRDFFHNHKATLQILQPQQHTPNLADFLSDLEEYFGCLVGSNVYITPANSKGLAPHYDDVEVFILQLEGTKRWMVHEPITHLPRECSNDLEPEAIGKPILDIVLEKGDILYFPRGWIHHAETTDVYSSHLTISTYQKHSYFDFLGRLLPTALEEAGKSLLNIRKGLPLRFFSNFGTTYHTHDAEMKKQVLTVCNQLGNSLMSYFESSLDESVDDLSLDFIQSRLPPSTNQLKHYLDGCEVNENTDTYGPMPDSSDIFVRLLNPSYMRLVIDDPSSSQMGSDESDESDEENSDEGNEEEPPMLISTDSKSDKDDDDDNCDEDEDEDGDNDEEGNVKKTALLFYSTKNDPRTHMVSNIQPNCARFSIEIVPAFQQLMKQFPNFIKIQDLVEGIEDEQIGRLTQGLVVALWSLGLLITKVNNNDRKTSKKRTSAPSKNLPTKKQKISK